MIRRRRSGRRAATRAMRIALAIGLWGCGAPALAEVYQLEGGAARTVLSTLENEIGLGRPRYLVWNGAVMRIRRGTARGAPADWIARIEDRVTGSAPPSVTVDASLPAAAPKRRLLEGLAETLARGHRVDTDDWSAFAYLGSLGLGAESAEATDLVAKLRVAVGEADSDLVAERADLVGDLRPREVLHHEALRPGPRRLADDRDVRGFGQSAYGQDLTPEDGVDERRLAATEAAGGCDPEQRRPKPLP